MNILILNPILYTADNNTIPEASSIKDTMIYNMCLGFKNIGHNVTLISTEDYKPKQAEQYDFEIYFLKTQFKKIFLPAVIPFSTELFFFIKKQYHKFDLIISSEVFSFQSLFASLFAAKKTAIWHELAHHQKKFKQYPSKIWYNIIVPIFMRKTLVIPRSKNAYDFIKKYHKKTSRECVEHGINIEQFTPDKAKDDYLLIIAQLIKRKNIASIIIKFTDFLKQEKYNNYKLYIIGHGPLEEELKKLVLSLNMTERIFFTGFMAHDRMVEFVKSAKCLLINTLQDNNMVSIPETLACATPVLTNSIPTNSNIIEKHRLGIVKDNWGVNDLNNLIINNKEYVENCYRYRKFLSSQYSAQHIINISNKYL